MKKLLVLLVIIIPLFLFARPIDNQQAQQKAIEFINSRLVVNRIESILEISNNSAFLIKLSPQGFILLSTDDEIHPIIGYSFQDDFTSNSEEIGIMQYWLGK